jgi:hypothetical protein
MDSFALWDYRYWNFIYTGRHDFIHLEIPAVIRRINHNIGYIHEKIDYLHYILKEDKVPLGHPEAIDIRAEIERLNDKVRTLRKRKAQLSK